MKLFFTVFAAILAAAAVIMTSIYAKARLDDWEKAKWGFIAQMNNENARSKAVCDAYMAKAMQWVDNVANVKMYTEAALKESQENLKRIREIQQRAKEHLENKPFWIPLTADEKRGLTDLRSEIAKRNQPTPTPMPDQEKYDKSMKPTTEAGEAERQRITIPRKPLIGRPRRKRFTRQRSTPYTTASDFAEYATKLREQALEQEQNR
jgi:hypothetical protein